jgi:hypothetical protein
MNESIKNIHSRLYQAHAIILSGIIFCLPCNTSLQNGILCITQNIPTELYSNVAPIILERNPHCERTIQISGI